MGYKKKERTERFGDPPPLEEKIYVWRINRKRALMSIENEQKRYNKNCVSEASRHLAFYWNDTENTEKTADWLHDWLTDY